MTSNEHGFDEDSLSAQPLINVPYTVVSTLGALLLFLGTPLLLGSLYRTQMSLVLICLLALRTLDEEALLVNELEGYAEYTKKVQYRLIPFVW